MPGEAKIHIRIELVIGLVPQSGPVRRQLRVLDIQVKVIVEREQVFVGELGLGLGHIGEDGLADLLVQ